LEREAFLMIGNVDIGIDLGTANTLIYVKGKGIIINEPSVIAIDKSAKKVIAVGEKARVMLGKSPKYIKVIRPLEEGVISNFEMAAVMLKEFLGRVMVRPGLFSRIRVVVGVPSGVTEVEKRAVEEVIRQMGAKEVYILDEPMAAAIGCGLEIESSTGCMIADVGGGTSDIAIIALEGIVTSTSLRIAGDKIDESIANYMRSKYELLIGDQMAEQVKKNVGCAYVDDNDDTKFQASGRDIITGLPRTVTLSRKELLGAMQEPIEQILDGIKLTLENAPPEISADIVKNGMVLAGGGAYIFGIDKLIKKETGLDANVAENALEAVAHGTGLSLENIQRLQRYASNKKK